MILAHKIRLYPNKSQEDYFLRACGTHRFIWNLALEEWNRQYKNGGKPSGSSLRVEFNGFKYYVYPWLAEVHRDACSQAFIDLQTAFSRFFNGKARRPRFKKKGMHDSFYVANDRLMVKDKSVCLPRLGWVKMAQPLRFSGKVMGARVVRLADYWFIAIQVDVGEYHKPRTDDKVLGVDLGLNHFATLSDGRVFDAPKPLAKNLKRLRRKSRQHSRKKLGSNNRKKAQRKLARLHLKIKRQRLDFIHKLTTLLCRESQAIGIEDLNVKGMMRNRCLSRAIADVGWGEVGRQLEYKSRIYGTDLQVADRFFPSSQLCSSCGNRQSLALSERVFRCKECGVVLDRDYNAALNLCTLGYRGIHACGDRVRPACEAAVVEAGIGPLQSQELIKG